MKYLVCRSATDAMPKTGEGSPAWIVKLHGHVIDPTLGPYGGFYITEKGKFASVEAQAQYLSTVRHGWSYRPVKEAEPKETAYPGQAAEQKRQAGIERSSDGIRAYQKRVKQARTIAEADGIPLPKPLNRAAVERFLQEAKARAVERAAREAAAPAVTEG